MDPEIMAQRLIIFQTMWFSESTLTAGGKMWVSTTDDDDDSAFVALRNTEGQTDLSIITNFQVLQTTV